MHMCSFTALSQQRQNRALWAHLEGAKICPEKQEPLPCLGLVPECHQVAAAHKAHFFQHILCFLASRGTSRAGGKFSLFSLSSEGPQAPAFHMHRLELEPDSLVSAVGCEALVCVCVCNYIDDICNSDTRKKKDLHKLH